MTPGSFEELGGSEKTAGRLGSPKLIRRAREAGGLGYAWEGSWDPPIYPWEQGD